MITKKNFLVSQVGSITLKFSSDLVKEIEEEPLCDTCKLNMIEIRSFFYLSSNGLGFYFYFFLHVAIIRSNDLECVWSFYSLK